MQESLSVADNLLFLDSKLVVPSTLRSKMLTDLHEGNSGIDKMKMRARQWMYWLGITKGIEEEVLKLEICVKFQGKNNGPFWNVLE